MVRILKKRFPFKRFVLIGLIALLAFGCTQEKKHAAVKRYASITGLKAEKLSYYKKLHAEAWPAVLQKIKECHIQNYSIFLKEIAGEYYLFSYFEYTGTDFSSDMQRMAADAETQRWWKETDPCQNPLPEAKEKSAIWSDMTEVFHTD